MSGKLTLLRFAHASTLIAGLTLPTASIHAQGPAQPNVLFLYIEDANYDLGAFGHPVVQTPSLDALATNGVRFQRAYCPYPVCGPSRLATMLSRRPATTGFVGNEGFDILEPEFDGTPILPKRFKDAGYSTGAAGKVFHVVQQHPDTWDFYFEEWRDLGPSWPPHPAPQDGWRTKYGGPYENGADGSLGDFEDTKYSNAGMAMMQGLPEPWFVNIGYVAPHSPYVYPEAFDDLYDPATDVPPLPPEESGNWQDTVPEEMYFSQSYVDPAWGATDDERRRQAVVHYWRTLTYIDHEIGRVLAHLDTLGMRERTIVVVVSDHGFALGEHTRYDKFDLWDHSVMAPMLVSVPWLSTGGQVCNSLVEHIDIYPTLMHYCNLTPPPGLQGDSLQPQLEDPTVPGDPVFAMVPRRWRSHWHHMVRSDQYKLIHDEKGHHLFYDMVADPGEYVNLAEDPGYATLVQQHEQMLIDAGVLTAFSSNFLRGSEGTNGVPTLTLDAPPLLGTTPNMLIGNTSGMTTTIALMGGLRATRQTGPEVLGGPLLLFPEFVIPFTVPTGGLSLPFDMPLDFGFSGISTLWQTIQIDSGNPNGIAFSRGLRIHALPY